MGVYIIAEAGVNHNGNIVMAQKLIDMAKKCGADAIKFQTFKAEESTSLSAEKVMYQKKNDTTNESQFDMVRKLELPFYAFKELKEYAESIGIDFISTPDGEESLRYLLDINIKCIKIGSTEVTNYPFLHQISLSKKPIILSTGMSTLGDVEKALSTIYEAGNHDVTLMHCTTDYPTSINEVNMRAMKSMHDAFHVPVGYSDHTLGIDAAIAATVLGACMIEKHITLDRSLPGPDHKASMEQSDFTKYVQHIRDTENLLGDGIKRPTLSEQQNMLQVRRSVMVNRSLTRGTTITEDMLCYKRPGDGISPEYANILIGRILKRDINAEEKISWEDV